MRALIQTYNYKLRVQPVVPTVVESCHLNGNIVVVGPLNKEISKKSRSWNLWHGSVIDLPRQVKCVSPCCSLVLKLGGFRGSHCPAFHIQKIRNKSQQSRHGFHGGGERGSFLSCCCESSSTISIWNLDRQWKGT